jgi:hypothetical protein
VADRREEYCENKNKFVAKKELKLQRCIKKPKNKLIQRISTRYNKLYCFKIFWQNPGSGWQGIYNARINA